MYVSNICLQEYVEHEIIKKLHPCKILLRNLLLHYLMIFSGQKMEL